MKLKILFLIVLVSISMASEAEAPAKKRLPPCKDTPNCVSTQATDKLHYIAPFKISGDAKTAWLTLRDAIKAHDRMVITHETEDSLHAEATSLVLSFVDDIDAFLDLEAGVIQIRSSSRIGHSDFGVNRKRIESFRQQLRKLHVLSR